MAKLLLADEKMDPNMRADVETISLCSKNLLRLLDDVLELTAIENDQVRINCEFFEVRSDVSSLTGKQLRWFFFWPE